MTDTDPWIAYYLRELLATEKRLKELRHLNDPREFNQSMHQERLFDHLLGKLLERAKEIEL